MTGRRLSSMHTGSRNYCSIATGLPSGVKRRLPERDDLSHVAQILRLVYQEVKHVLPINSKIHEGV